MKVRSVADVVAQGIQKAANLKSLQFAVSHRDQPNDEEYKAKKKNLGKLESRILRSKNKIQNLKNDLSLITEQNKIADLLNELTAINSEIKEMEELLKILKAKKADQIVY